MEHQQAIQRPEQGKPLRRWAFTLQLPSAQHPDRDSWSNLVTELSKSFDSTIATTKRNLTFLILQIERASTGQLHAQGAITVSQPVRLGPLKQWIPQAHWEGARDWAKLVAYCQKTETRVEGPFQMGTNESQQGHRSDLAAAASMIQSGSRMNEVADLHPTVVVKFHKGLQYLRSLQQQDKFQPKKVGLFWGLTGTGKTYTVFNEKEDVYRVADIKTPWFDGYAGHETALLDECGMGMMNFNKLKEILDQYKMDVPVKGAMVAWTPKTIILTSNTPMEEWWYPQPSKADMDALRRRVRSFYFPDEKQLALAWLRGALIEPLEPAAKRLPPMSLDRQVSDLPQDLYDICQGY